MLDKELVKDLRSLQGLVKPSAVWRDQARQQILSLAEQKKLPQWSTWEMIDSRLLAWRIKLAPVPAMSLVVTFALLIIITPFMSGLATAQPGDLLYSVKRFEEKVSVVFKTTNEARGEYYLSLAERRLEELQTLDIGDANQGKLLRDYNIALSFARAYYQATPAATFLAENYDAATNALKVQLKSVIVVNGNREVYKVAYDLTDKLNNDALVTLASLGQLDNSSALVMQRLNEEITKVEERLASVQVKIDDLPLRQASTSRVVIESKKTVVAPADASKEVAKTLQEAKELIDKQEFTLALQKIKEGEVITLKTEEVVDETIDDANKEGEVQGASDAGEVLVPAAEVIDTDATPAITDEEQATIQE